MNSAKYELKDSNYLGKMTWWPSGHNYIYIYKIRKNKICPVQKKEQKVRLERE